MESNTQSIQRSVREIIEKGALDSLPYGISIHDSNFRIVYQNRAQKARSSDCVGEYCYKAYEMRDTVCEDCPGVAVFRDGGVHQQIKTTLTEKGFEHMEITASPLQDSTGKIIAVIEVAIDITARRRSEVALRESEERYRSLVESTDDSIYLVDRNYQYIFINKRHLSRLGISRRKSRGYSFSDFHSSEETEFFREKIDTIFRTKRSEQYEYKSLRDERYFLQTYSPVYDLEGNINAVTIVSKDITERKIMEDKLRNLSLTDELTGIYNRRGFFILAEQQLKLANRDRKGIFIVCIDLDFLKQINDNLGHRAGDLALIETSRILKQSFRDSDIVARIGGDEFVVVAQEASGGSTMQIISRLRENTNAHNAQADRMYELSFSVGITRYDPDQRCNIDQLLSRADKLMYEEKKKKKA